MESTISAYQNVIERWVQSVDPTAFNHFPTKFALERAHKKFERPNENNKRERAQRAWDEWIKFDHQLPLCVNLPHPVWYKARHLIHHWCESFTPGVVEFPKGSSFEPTRGRNSIESRLARGKWTCTRENFDRAARLIYNHKALKRAYRKRYTRWFNKSTFDMTETQADRFLWRRFTELGVSNPSWACFEWKLERIVSFEYGSRFTTVPKNNLDDRPIDVNCLLNFLTQRQIGLGLKQMLSANLSIDLDSLALLHRQRIRDNSIATVDLKNASDSVSLALIRFLFPKRIVRLIESARAPFVLGPDGAYHEPRKISSMGNGFTFELMTVVLTALCRVYDSDATVFGDDIIISKLYATELISRLNEVGFVVNQEKSFLSGPFRESCGANFHDDFGYIESYDFRWPETIADCALLYNKTKILSRVYLPFDDLEKQLYRVTPKALRGGPIEGTRVSDPEDQFNVSDEPYDLPLYFGCGHSGVHYANHRIRDYIKTNYCGRDIRSFPVLRFKPALASNMSSHCFRNSWAKVEMYLAAGRRVPDVISKQGSWSLGNLISVDGALMNESTIRSIMKMDRYYTAMVI